MSTGGGEKRVSKMIHRLVAARNESGQALAIVIIVIVLLVGFSVSLANQSNQQAPIAEQSVLARLAMQAAQAGLADYQDFISANPANASSFCSYTTFSACTSQSTSVANTNGVSLPTATVDVTSTSGFSTSAIISVESSTGAQSLTCTGTSTSPTAFTGCSGGTGIINSGYSVTQYELPGGIDPAFQNAFTTSSSCTGNTAASGWATATLTSLGSQNASYQYLVNSSSLEGSASGGEVYVYATGRAGISGNYVCRSVQAAFWVQLTQPGVPQTVATNDSYSSIDVPSSCQSSCTTTTATITVAGGSGGNGGTGANGTGGTGGDGEEIQATFQIPTGMSLSSDIGYEGMTAANNTDPSTTISSITGSCSSSLPIGSTGEICVSSTSGFNIPISLYVASSGGAQLVTCDSDSSATFTHCTGGSGTLAVGGAVDQPWSSGYGAGGASGNPGGGYSYGGSYSSSGSGGGASAVCLEPSVANGGGTCTSSTPLCTGPSSGLSATSDCVLVVSAGGGGAGEGGQGGSAGNGGTGGSPAGAFPSTVGAADELTTAQAEGLTEAGSSGGSGYGSFGQQTGAAGGGGWVASATASSNTATGGSAGTSESIFGDSTPAGSPGQPNSSGSPATVTVTSMSGSHNGANGPAFSGDGCFWWCTGAAGGGGGGGLSGGGSGASGGDGGAGAGGGGASYFDVGALYTPSTGTCSSGPCVVVGTATAGNGFSNFTVQNISNTTIPTAKTQCLNDGGGGTYSPCSPTFDPDPTWYTVAPTSPCSTTCDSAGQLESCGTPYTTEAPPGAYTGQAWLYGGGGGGGYGGSPTPGGSGGNGAAALVDFNAVPNDFYAVELGCGGGGGGTSTAGAGVDGGSTGSSKTGGGGGATVLCFDGTSATASCSHATAGCPTTSTTLASGSAPCILAIVGGGGGGKTGGGAGGGPTGTGTSTTWCSTNSQTTDCNGNAGYNGNTAGSGGAGGASWFATSASGNTGPVESLSTSASEPCTAGTITNVLVSCLVNNSETSYPPTPSTVTPCGGTGAASSANNASEDTSQSTNGGTAGSGDGCGGYSPTSSATGWQGYAGQLGYWSGSGYTGYYGWVNWTVYTPALESGACDFTGRASTPWGPPSPNSETIAIPNTGTYTLTVGGGSGASGWQTAGTGNFGNGGSGSELTFKLTLTALQQLTVVAGCGGFGNLGGLGFGNGGSSGFQPQGTYSSNSDSLNGTPVLNGAGGGGGGASALCLSNSNVTSPTCTPSTPICTDTSPGSDVTCVLAVAGGGGGGGTDYVCNGTSCPQLALDTDCTTTGSDLDGGGGLTTTASANSFSGIWTPGTEGSGGASNTHYYYGAGTAGATGGSSSSTSSGQPQSYSGSNPAPNTPTGGSVSNGGNGGWYIGSGIPTGSSFGGIGAGGGGGGFQGGWADPWEPSGKAVPTDANPEATSSANQYLTGSSGSAAECGAGAGSSWLTGAAVSTSVQTGSNASTNGIVTVLYDPPGSSQITSSSQVPVYQTTW